MMLFITVVLVLLLVVLLAAVVGWVAQKFSDLVVHLIEKCSEHV